MRESCTYGSMRGAPSNGRPYRNRQRRHPSPTAGWSRKPRRRPRDYRAWPRRDSPGGDQRARLGRKQGLGAHSGAIGDGIADLMEAGIVDNRHKIDPAVTVATMLMGTSRLHRFADRNPVIQIRATSYTHDALVLGAIAATCASVWVRAFLAYGMSRSIAHRSTLSAGHGL
jgi:hypothetical protein